MPTMNSELKETARAFSQVITSSIRFWERMRIVYNLILLGITFYHGYKDLGGCCGWSWDRLAVGLFILGVIANVLYCAAYIPDILIQLSDYRKHIVKVRYSIWVVGCAFAACWTWLISGDMF